MTPPPNITAIEQYRGFQIGVIKDNNLFSTVITHPAISPMLSPHEYFHENEAYAEGFVLQNARELIDSALSEKGKERCKQYVTYH